MEVSDFKVGDKVRCKAADGYEHLKKNQILTIKKVRNYYKVTDGSFVKNGFLFFIGYGRAYYHKNFEYLMTAISPFLKDYV